MIVKQEYLLLLPMVLGAIAMVIGAIRFLNSFLYETCQKLPGIKIKYPSTWRTHILDEIAHLNNSTLDLLIMPKNQTDSNNICVYLSRRDNFDKMMTKDFIDIIKQDPYCISTAGIKILHTSVINLSGNPTNEIICSFNDDDYYLQGYWTQKYHITYIIIFRIKADKHRNYLPTIGKMINSLELEPNITLKASS